MASSIEPERLDKLYGEIPGSKPSWRGANIKTKGKAAVEHTPPAGLGETGWAAWTSSQDSKPGYGRRHYHDSPLTQTVARAILPCVDIAEAAGPGANLQLSGSLAAAYQEQRRHRRMIATPPEKHRPQGKKMVTNHASDCLDLLGDPEAAVGDGAIIEPDCNNRSPLKVSAAAVVHNYSISRGSDSTAAACNEKQQQQQQVLPAPAANSGDRGPNRSSSKNSKSPVGDHQGESTSSGSSSSSSNGSTKRSTAAADSVPAAGDVATSRTGVPPRVQDNPDYFRTLKDPPAFQRFCASITARHVAEPERDRAAARHELGLHKKHNAAVELARREVAALQMQEL